MHQHVHALAAQELSAVLVSLELGERRVGIEQSLDRAFEEHEHHHDAEDLQAIAGHVHHYGVHRDLLGRG